ncbi:MAG TPA: fumarylacetoacetate hydrolase family protein [Thermoplasmata archaeon]|nr:fumarylacetoacetate hydrolase family protein [Thermoplasmata archaeon]
MSRVISVGGRRIHATKILCVARNYADHAKEMNTAVPAEPIFFLKPTTALLPGGGRILLPPDSERVEVETELAVILERGGADVAPDGAMGLVAGYAVFFDITARDLQTKARREGSPWTAAKGFDTFAPISTGVAASRVPDPHALPIRLKVNGVVRQDSNTGQMVFRIPQLLAAASRIMSLERGDILATGTPAGVWPIVAGDVLEAEIPGVGSLKCTAAARNR